MPSSFLLERAHFAVLCALLGATPFACSAGEASREPRNPSVAGAGDRGGSTWAGSSGAHTSGAGSLGTPGNGGGAHTSGAGSLGTPGNGGAFDAASPPGGAGGGGRSDLGLAGAPLGGTHSGGTSAGVGGEGSGGVGSAGTSAVCQMIKVEYQSELEKQLLCNPKAASQCANKVAAAPGCDCRVFIQPTDPFAIEHLSNVMDGWFGADCSTPSCPAKCTTAATGTCQADSNSSLGGHCMTP